MEMPARLHEQQQNIGTSDSGTVIGIGPNRG
jgi:hypothetical protein